MMNMALSYLEEHRVSLDLERLGVPRRLTSVVLTPRFQASRHAVFLILPVGRVRPVLVAKVPRLPDAGEFLEREVRILRAVQALRPGGFASVPEVVAYDTYCGYPILLETAIVGTPMSKAVARRDMARCCRLGVEWLVEVQQPQPDRGGADWFDRLVLEPLAAIENASALTPDEERALAVTRQLAARLQEANLPPVLEHGDLSHPNLIVMPHGGLGVVDWELARLDGLVACDLFFFLTYIAFARNRARSLPEYLQAFHEAFFGTEAWARPYISHYARALELPTEALAPLFVLTWARYTGQLVARVREAGGLDDRLSGETADWLRSNRYHALWLYAASHVGDLSF